MKRIAAVLLATAAVACGDKAPSRPSTDSVAIVSVQPANGSTVVIPAQYPYHDVGGVVLPPESNLMSVRVQIVSAHDVPWAQLNVYLLTDRPGMEYCGQNIPDSPTWQFLTPGWTADVTVTGFQVILPCHVTGVRAMLHMRNNGALTPPSPSETIAEGKAAADFQLTR